MSEEYDMSLAVVAYKGQLVLPLEIQEYLHVKRGDKLDFSIDEHGKVVLTPKNIDVSELYGMIKKKKKATLKKDGNEDLSNINYAVIPPGVFENYRIKQPIEVRINMIEDDEYIAEFEEVGIAFAAANPTEAIQLLKAQIIYTYEAYKSKSRLGPEPLRQLIILEKYIGKKRGQ